MTMIFENSIHTDFIDSNAKKILVVDDDEIWLSLISEGIKKSHPDFELRQAASEEQFKKQMASFHPDLVVSDFYLDHHQHSIQILKDDVINKDKVPYIIVSGITFDKYQQIIGKTGTETEFLTKNLPLKPFFEQLDQRVHAILDSDQSTSNWDEIRFDETLHRLNLIAVWTMIFAAFMVPLFYFQFRYPMKDVKTILRAPHLNQQPAPPQKTPHQMIQELPMTELRLKIDVISRRADKYAYVFSELEK